jgi:hypothetical protein
MPPSVRPAGLTVLNVEGGAGVAGAGVGETVEVVTATVDGDTVGVAAEVAAACVAGVVAPVLAATMAQPPAETTTTPVTAIRTTFATVRFFTDGAGGVGTGG